MMTIEDWKKEADQQMKKHAIEDSEKFNFWLGFVTGLEKAEFALKN